MSWLASVIAESRRRRIGIPQLPAFIQKCTAQVKLQCVCIESNLDSGTALALELEEDFGLRCVSVDAAQISQEAVQSVDLIVSSVFHAPAAEALATAAGTPHRIVTVNEELARIIERRVAGAGLTAIVADPKYAERFMNLYGSRGPIRIVYAQDRSAIALLSRSEPVLVTRAARRMLPDLDLPLLVPLYPSISAESARELAELIIRLNLRQEKR